MKSAFLEKLISHLDQLDKSLVHKEKSILKFKIPAFISPFWGEIFYGSAPYFLTPVCSRSLIFKN